MRPRTRSPSIVASRMSAASCGRNPAPPGSPGSGAKVLLAGFNERTLAAAAAQLRVEGHDVTEQRVDVSDHASVAALADAAAALGPVLQVAHTAGLSPVQASVEAIVGVDLLGVACVLDEFARVVAPGGAGVVIASTAGHFAADSISPGIISTPMGAAELAGESGAQMGLMAGASATARLPNARAAGGASVGVPVRHPLQEVARLTLEDLTHGLQGREANRLGAPVLQDRHVRRRDTDTFGELPDGHLPLRQLKVDPDDDRHQITISMSVRRVIAWVRSARIVQVSSARAMPVMTPPARASIHNGGPATVCDW